MIEAEAIAAAQAGDPAGLDWLYRTHCPYVRNICSHFMPGDQRVEDWVQAVFLVVCRKIGRFRAQSSFRTWLFIITRNECLMELRRDERQVPVVSFTELLAAPGMVGRDPSTAPSPETALIVAEALNALPEGQRQVFLERVIEGRGPTELAAKHGLTIPAVKGRLRQARAKLQEALA